MQDIHGLPVEWPKPVTEVDKRVELERQLWDKGNVDLWRSLPENDPNWRKLGEIKKKAEDQACATGGDIKYPADLFEPIMILTNAQMNNGSEAKHDKNAATGNNTTGEATEADTAAVTELSPRDKLVELWVEENEDLWWSLADEDPNWRKLKEFEDKTEHFPCTPCLLVPMFILGKRWCQKSMHNQLGQPEWPR
jgi:hypothetical protein